MPVRASHLMADKRPLKIPFGDDVLSLEYTPSAVNAVQEARENADKAAGRELLSQAKSLAEMIASWDMLDDDGKPLPITADEIGKFGLDVTNKLMNAMLDDLLPNRRRASSSPNGSSAGASSEPAPTGTPTS